MTVPLSVLDLAPVPSGHAAADALRNSVDLARHADRLGYRRYWVAEHHLVPGVTASAPAVLIGQIAAATQRIRVGSGAVLLGYYPPLPVVEQFGTLAQFYPDRIDLGLGRSGFVKVDDLLKRFANPSDGPPPQSRTVDGLLIPGRPRSARHGKEFVERFAETEQLLGVRDDAAGDYTAPVQDVLRWLDGTFKADSGREYLSTPATGAELEVWVLGSSAGPSALAAAHLGLPFTANYHVSPTSVLEAVQAYRDAFVPSKRLAEPHVMVSADVVVAETDDQARELAAPYARWVLSIRDGSGAIPFPTPEEAADFDWTEEQRAMVADRTATQFVGTGDTVASKLDTLQRATGADELLVTTITHDHADRVRSFELLAKAWR